MTTKKFNISHACNSPCWITIDGKPEKFSSLLSPVCGYDRSFVCIRFADHRSYGYRGTGIMSIVPNRFKQESSLRSASRGDITITKLCYYLE